MANQRLALGAAQFGLPYGVANQDGQISRDEAERILDHAWSAGLDTLDTAIEYGDSEQRLGELGVGQWHIISKLPPMPESCTDVAGWVEESVAGSLSRLKIKKLHGLLLHRPQQLLGVQRQTLYAAVDALKTQGLVDKIGVSIYDPQELDPLWSHFHFDLVQAPFNILDRRLVTTDWLTRLQQAGAEVHVRSVFLQGLLLMRSSSRPSYFQRWQPLWAQWHQWLTDTKLTPLQACLTFVLAQRQIDRVIVGIDSLKHLQDILAVAEETGIEPPAHLLSVDSDLINPSKWKTRLKTVAIVQARMGSIRFPGKVMRPICGTPMIGLLLGRLSQSKRIDQIVLATSQDPRNEPLAEYVRKLGFAVFQGSENDVLDRYYQTALEAGADVVVRITGDCPLIDPQVVDAVIDLFQRKTVDYAANTVPPTFPNGLDTEVFTFQVLEMAWKQAKEPYEREHVTPFVRESGLFRVENLPHEDNHSSERWTVDEPEDFEVVQKVFEYFHPRSDFGWLEVLALRHEHPEWFIANQHLLRDEGARLDTGQKLWRRAKRVIPGGNMLLSKRPETFLPEQWPAYFSKAKGCRVWDLDGREYIDMSIMGIGTNILGYGHPEVDEAVHQTIAVGNMSTLNCPEEVYLAERLVELHPWADMARFARSGGEANAIAIRIARAATRKTKVAFCGYHGWHDWYLAANLGDEKNLAGHLLPGLEPNGVPANLRDTIYPFNYNRFDELEALVNTHDIGVIKMEVARNQGPEEGFLQKVRQLATERGIVLIFDECTSGFRQTFGGLHKLYGVEPDMAMFGKALGNGYAITAVIGRRGVMEAAQISFISSTFWTERIGPTAGLKTLEVMERERSWETITKTGRDIGERWQALAAKHGLPIQLNGLPALIGFSFPLPDILRYKTLITQEMLAKGYLAATSVYVCTAHTPEVVDAYFDALDPVFSLIRQCEEGRDVNSLLRGPVCHAGFKRLN